MSIYTKTTREALRDTLGEMATGKERKILSHGALLAYINGTDHFSDFLSETTGDDYCKCAIWTKSKSDLFTDISSRSVTPPVMPFFFSDD